MSHSKVKPKAQDNTLFTKKYKLKKEKEKYENMMYKMMNKKDKIRHIKDLIQLNTSDNSSKFTSGALNFKPAYRDSILEGKFLQVTGSEFKYFGVGDDYKIEPFEEEKSLATTKTRIKLNIARLNLQKLRRDTDS